MELQRHQSVRQYQFNLTARYWITMCAWVVAVCLAWAGGALLSQPAFAQIPGLGALTADKSGTALPPGVKREGQVEAMGVYLDGRPLFEIASPTVLDRSQPGELVPVEVRAKEIEARLQRLLSRDNEADTTTSRNLATRFDPETIRIQIDTGNGGPVLSATDASARPEELLTVTPTDAEYQVATARELAERWRGILQTELRDALEKRQPQATLMRLLRLAGILVVAILATFLLSRFSARLGRRKDALLQQQQEAEQATASQAEASQTAAAKAAVSRETAEPNAEDVVREERVERKRLSKMLRHQSSVQRRRHMIGTLYWLVSWGLVFIWAGAIAGVFYQFPQTRGVADKIVAIPGLALVAWFAAGLINALATLVIDRVATAWSEEERLAGNPRESLRVPTVVTALKGLVGTILYAGAIVLVLEFLLVVPVTVVWIGAIIALALSFAAQNLVKDLVNGALILFEDAYALGDRIAVKGLEGVVERLNLRITQIRTGDGRLVTIPNHMVTQVENKTRLWSRVDLCVTVAYDSNVDRALAVVEQVAEELERDPQWRPLILEPHEMLGVDEISHAGIVIHFQVKTLPFKKDSVARELRRRLKIAFDREGIEIGIPQQISFIAAEERGKGLLPEHEDRSWLKRERTLQPPDAAH